VNDTGLHRLPVLIAVLIKLSLYLSLANSFSETSANIARSHILLKTSLTRFFGLS